MADTAHHFEYYAGLAGKTAGEAHLLPEGNLLTIVRVPVGVVGAINPWNFPIAGAGLKGAPILAAGNSLVLKPSSLTSLSTLAVAELALEAGVPPGVFNVVTGGGAEVGGALARHPDVGLLSFTGGTETGFGVMRDRAEVGRAVQLELGGKSPTIVFDDVDLDEVVPAAAFGIYMNQGQNCSAGSRVLVHEAIHDRFVEALTELSASIRVLPPFDPQSQLGSLVSGDHLDKVHAWVERARSDGATITTGGHALTGDPYGRGHFYAPTVITETGRADAAFREEIFGPVVVVAPFSTEAEAIEIANENRYGLAASVWTSDGRRALRVATAIDAGFVWMNTINAPPDRGAVRRRERLGLRPRGGAPRARDVQRPEVAHHGRSALRRPVRGLTSAATTVERLNVAPRPDRSMLTELMSVTGPVARRISVITLPHEHTFLDVMREYRGDGLIHDPQLVERELVDLRAEGGRTLVDCTSRGLRPEPALVRAASEASGITIILGTGFYRHPFLDEAWFDAHSTDEVADLIVRDIRDGIDGTGVRAGVIGEIGCDRFLTPAEERGFRAAARAHHETGLTITTHAARWRVGHAQLDLLASEGVPAGRVIVGHCDMVPDLDYHRELADGAPGSSSTPSRADPPYRIERIVGAIRALRCGRLLRSDSCSRRTSA